MIAYWVQADACAGLCVNLIGGNIRKCRAGCTSFLLWLRAPENKVNLDRYVPDIYFSKMVQMTEINEKNRIWAEVGIGLDLSRFFLDKHRLITGFRQGKAVLFGVGET